jgi:hypothetical protein
MKSGRLIVGQDGKAVAVEFDHTKRDTHAAAHGYEDAITAGTAFNALTPAELTARREKATAAAVAEASAQKPPPPPAGATKKGSDAP